MRTRKKFRHWHMFFLLAIELSTFAGHTARESDADISQPLVIRSYCDLCGRGVGAGSAAYIRNYEVEYVYADADETGLSDFDIKECAIKLESSVWLMKDEGKPGGIFTPMVGMKLNGYIDTWCMKETT